MIIEINADWRISSDPYQWILEQRRGTRKDRKTGEAKPNWKQIAFYPELSSLLLRLIDLRAWRMDGTYPPEALEHVCNALGEIKAEVREAIAHIDRDYLKLVAARDASGKQVIGDVRWSEGHSTEMPSPANDTGKTEMATRHRSPPPSP